MTLYSWRAEYHAEQVASAHQREARAASCLIQAKEAEDVLRQIDRTLTALTALDRAEAVHARIAEAIDARLHLSRMRVKHAPDLPVGHTHPTTSEQE